MDNTIVTNNNNPDDINIFFKNGQVVTCIFCDTKLKVKDKGFQLYEEEVKQVQQIQKLSKK